MLGLRLLLPCRMRGLIIFLLLGITVKGLTIKVDYRFDTSGFFDTPEAKAAVEAAAARWSRVIDQELLPVNIQDDDWADRRFKLFHPATGEIHELSAAASKGSDFLVASGIAPADEYLDGFTLEQDEWILFVGARPQSSIARGGPLAGGVNTADTFDDPDGFLNRGFNKGINSLTVLGGSISFNSTAPWSFDLSNPKLANGTDLYTIALHEIGHGLGLSARGVKEWTDLVSNGSFRGGNALAASHDHAGEPLGALEIQSESTRDYHWKENAYRSAIFPLGDPNYLGTVGRGELQNLLMEPMVTFAKTVSRIEITNIDVGGIRDLGWSVLASDPPRDPILPSPQISTASDGGLSLSFPSEVGATYIIQTSTSGETWLDVTPSLNGDGSTLSWTDGRVGFSDPSGPAAHLDRKFYRVIKN